MQAVIQKLGPFAILAVFMALFAACELVFVFGFEAQLGSRNSLIAALVLTVIFFVALTKLLPANTNETERVKKAQQGSELSKEAEENSNRVIFRTLGWIVLWLAVVAYLLFFASVNLPYSYVIILGIAAIHTCVVFEFRKLNEYACR